tara:strand:- start:1430 stop:1996 length:567 start_codon:yes stop_codon:yes gene_type:complete
MASGKDLEVVTLPSGVTMGVNPPAVVGYDWPSIRVLAERGVPFAAIARHFNGLDPNTIAQRSQQDNWLTPRRERKMQKELAERQKQSLEKTGEVREITEVMEDIWVERQERINEKAFSMVEDALDSVGEEVIQDMITEAKDLKTVVEVGRKVTGQDRREHEEREQGPSLAINVGFLRSASNFDDPIDV